MLANSVKSTSIIALKNMNGNTNALHDSPPSLGPTARRTFASNVLDKKTADGSKIVERGESTPHAFAPGNSTHEDPEWPPWLENSIFRLILAVRETSPPPRAHSSAPTNPPSVTVDNTTPTCTAGDGNTESAEDQTEQPRPANRDTHPPETIQSQKSNTNKIRDSETHDTSEHHFPGGPEMLNNHTIDKQHKVLPTVEHSDRQPLNPPTAWLHAHRSSSPDEDILPKRVADSERYQQQSPTRITLPPASTYPEEQHHQLTQNKPMVTTKAATPATVTKPDSSLPPLRSSTEHTEGASHCPLSTVAEDTVESPVHQPAKHDTLALALTKTTLYTLNRKIIEGLNKTKHIVTHKNVAIASINNSTNITNTVSTVMSDFNVQCHPRTIKNLIVNPLLQCIEEHYFVLEREKHQTSIQLIRETYLSITNNPLFACLTDNIGHMIEETITNAIQYWQHTKLNSREIHPATMESSNTDTVDSAAHKHNVDSTRDCEKSKSEQAADLDNQTNKNNITRPIHTTDSTIASDTSTADNNTQTTTQTNKKPRANRKSLKKRKALSRPHAADDCTNPTCIPAYLKDTTHFISEISDIPVQNDTWLVTVDVKSLYTNIPNEEGIQACYEAWQQREITDPQHPPAQVLRHLLEMVLKLNTFEFDNKFYLQKFGTAMGSKLAPAYANTFVGKLEQNILSSTPLKLAYYRRFIDDIFIIWQHSERDLQNFITHMNRANRSIQFTHEKSQKDIVFLDVVVYKSTTTGHSGDNNITLNVKTHVKPTNKQLYVRNESYHPPGTGKGITVGEAIRYLRTNSEAQQYAKMLLQHKRNLIRRGYPNSRTTALLKQIKFTMRATKALKKRNNSKHQNKQVEQHKPTFVTKYCPNARKAFKIVCKHWAKISTEIPLLKRFLNNTPRLAYRANPNLTNKLVRAKLKRPPTNQEKPHLENTTDTNTDITELANLIHPAIKPGGNFTLCTNRSCPLHDKMIYKQSVRSKISRRAYHTEGSATCDTPRVVYMIQCRICGKQYVGQTAQSLKMRFARHLKAIRDTRQPGVLQEHFRKKNCTGIHNIRIQLLHAITPNRGDTAEQIEDKLKTLESLWMDRLKCEYPQGLNWAKYDPMKRSARKNNPQPRNN